MHPFALPLLALVLALAACKEEQAPEAVLPAASEDDDAGRPPRDGDRPNRRDRKADRGRKAERGRRAAARAAAEGENQADAPGEGGDAGVVGEEISTTPQAVFPPNIVDVGEQYYVRELGGLLTRLQTIMFDKYSLFVVGDAMAREAPLTWARRVLDIGTGTGALGLVALAHGAGRVVGTDLDPLAVENAALNARNLGLSDRFEARLVPASDPGAWSVVRPGEQFDLILSDPPQATRAGMTRAFPEAGADDRGAKEHYYSRDTGGALLTSLVTGLDAHLTPTGRAWILLKAKPAKDLLEDLVSRNGLESRALYVAEEEFRKHTDDRRLGEVPEGLRPELAVLYEVRRRAR